MSFANKLVMTFQGLILQQARHTIFPLTKRGIFTTESVLAFKVQNSIGRNMIFSPKMINKCYLKPPYLNSVFHMVSLMHGFFLLSKKIM